MAKDISKDAPKERGPIAWMTRNNVASNLLMFENAPALIASAANGRH